MSVSVSVSGAAQAAVDSNIDSLVADRVASRIAAKDFTLWGKDAEDESSSVWAGLPRQLTHKTLSRASSLFGPSLLLRVLTVSCFAVWVDLHLPQR